MTQKLGVVSPEGLPLGATRNVTPHLDTLDGKTVYLVDCRFDDSDILLKQVKAWFNEKMPAVNAVYKPIRSVYTKDDPQTWQEIQSTGHAAIVGVGH